MKINQTSPSTFYIEHYGHGLDTDWLVSFLLSHCTRSRLDTARICFHQDTESQLMAMMVIVLNGFEYPPHRHTYKAESYAIVRGRCNLKYYSHDGVLIRSSAMKQGDLAFNNTLFYHSLEPLSDMLVFIEHTSGPFRKNGNEFLDK